MAHICPENVQETTSITGTGSYTLLGAVSGFLDFDTFLATGDTVFYWVQDSTCANWEAGLGTFTSPSTLARTSILRSSNGDNAVSWASGTKTVVGGLPGEAMQTLLDPSLSNGYVKLTGGSPENTFSVQTVPIPIADGGTAATTSTLARASLGLVIGTDVQAHDAQLDDVAAVSPTADQFLGGNGSNLVMRTAAQVSASLGLGAIYSRGVPTRTRIALGSDQHCTASTTGYYAVTSLNAVAFPGTTDGSNKYDIWGSVTVDPTAGGSADYVLGVFVNASGDVSGTPIWEGTFQDLAGTAGAHTIVCPPVQATPTSGHKACFGIKRSDTADFDVISLNGCTFFTIQEVLD